METMIDVIENQEPLIAEKSEFGGSGTAPGAGFNESSGSAYVGKIGKTIYTNGRGIKYFNGEKVYYVNNQPIIIHSLHKDSLARISIINNDLTLTEKYLARIDELFETGNDLHKAYKEVFWDSLMEKSVDERIDIFIDLYPDPNVEILGYDFMKWHMVLANACLDGSLKYVERNNLSLDKNYSVKFLLKFVRKAFNPEVIKKILDKYGI